MADIAMLKRINRYLNAVPRWRCEVVAVGPFDLFLNQVGAHPWMTYARPARPFEGNLLRHVQAARRLFKDRGYTARWEYIEEISPGLSRALTDAGLPGPDMRPLMVLTSSESAPIPNGVSVRHIASREELRAASTVLHRAFGGSESEEPFDLSALEGGGIRALAAFVGGQLVAAGVHTPVEGVTELAGIGVLAEHRRRGIGAALTSALAEDARGQGCDLIFLSAGDEEIARIYRRAGFEAVAYAADTMEADA